RMSLILLFAFLPSSFVFAGDMGFVATTLPISLNKSGQARTFDRISRRLSRIIGHVGLTTAIALKIAGIRFKDIKIPCPSKKEFRKYAPRGDRKYCKKIGVPIALTAPRSRSGLVRFFHEKRDQEGGVYVRKLAQDQKLGAVIRSFWVLYGNEAEDLSQIGNGTMEIEISVAGYMPDSNAEQIAEVVIVLDRNMRFSSQKMRDDLTPQLIEIFNNLLKHSKMMDGDGFAEAAADEDF
ncbi:MAG: hypothetical protein KAH77_02890, partial [Thiomargarita sp.]|nr:hypothetical protein [Thiomargarita sp.]